MHYQEKQRLQIVGGPSKMDLLMSFAYAYDQERAFRTKMKDVSGAIYGIIPTSVSHEDESGNSFNLRGRIVGLYPGSMTKSLHVCAPHLPGTFSGRYNVQDRKGTLNVEFPLTND